MYPGRPYFQRKAKELAGLYNQHPQLEWEELVKLTIQIFKELNPRFDEDLFRFAIKEHLNKMMGTTKP